MSIDDSDADHCFTQYITDGSTEALGKALDSVAPQLMRGARSLTRREADAADLLQETFLIAIESCKRFEKGRALAPWLAGIMHNLHRTQRKARARPIDPSRLRQPDEPEPMLAVDRKLILQQIDSGIAQLPPPYREVVAMHLLEGLRPEAIGTALDRKPGQIRTQLWRGLSQLRDRLPRSLAPLLVGVIAANAVRGMDGAIPDGSDTDGNGNDSPTATGPTPDKLGPLRRTTAAPRLALAVLAPLVGLALLIPWLWHQEPATTAATPSRDLAALGAVPARQTPPADVQEQAPPRTSIASPTAATGSVAAHLDWTDTSQPVARQSVRLATGYRAGTPLLHTWFQCVREGCTDDAGNVLFTDVPAGTARLLFDDGMLCSDDFQVTAGGKVEIARQLMPGCQISGVVVDRDQHPVEGAVVWLSTSGGWSAPGHPAARSAADGTFTLRSLTTTWAIWATAKGMARSLVSCAAVAIGIERRTLVLGAAPARVGGFVRTVDGAPLAGALVAACPFAAVTADQSRETTAAPAYQLTDELGRYEFADLLPGKHLVIARGASTTAAAEQVELAADTTTNADLKLGVGALVRGNVKVNAGPAGLRVQLSPRRNSQAPSSAAIFESSAEVRADGTYEIAHAFPGAVELRVADTSTLYCREPVDLVEGQIADVDLEANATETVVGRVVDTSGAPLDFMEVLSLPAEFNWRSVLGGQGRAMTDKDGRFHFEVRRGLGYRFVVIQEQGFRAAMSDAVMAGAPEFTLTVDAATQANSSIRGQIADHASPHTAMDLELVQMPLLQSNRFRVAGDGTFELTKLPPGDYLLLSVPIEEQARNTTRTPLVRFHVGAGESRDLGQLAAERDAELQIELRRADGRPLKVRGPARVRTLPERELVGMVALRDGRAAVPIAHGDYEVEISGDDFVPVRQEIAVAPHEKHRFAVDLRPARSCTLTFVAPAGFPTGAMRITATGPDGRELMEGFRPQTATRQFRSTIGLPPGTNHLHLVSAFGFVADADIVVTTDGAADCSPMQVQLTMH